MNNGITFFLIELNYVVDFELFQIMWAAPFDWPMEDLILVRSGERGLKP